MRSVGQSATIWACLMAWASGCSSPQPAGVPPSTVAAMLWLPDDAVILQDAARPVFIESGRSIYVDGSGAVAFQLARACADFAASVERRFAEGGWSRRAVQDLHPQLSTSFESGCQEHGGGLIPRDARETVTAVEPFVQWMGEWQNAQGDIVSYVFGGDGPQLHGYASYNPRDTVERGLRKATRPR